jgi:hypothetical protein
MQPTLLGRDHAFRRFAFLVLPVMTISYTRYRHDVMFSREQLLLSRPLTTHGTLWRQRLWLELRDPVPARYHQLSIRLVCARQLEGNSQADLESRPALRRHIAQDRIGRH